MQVDGAAAEAPFLQQLKVEAAASIRRPLPAANQDRHQEQLVRIDQPSGKRLSRKLGTPHGEISGRRRLQLTDRCGIELSLNARPLAVVTACSVLE